MDQSEDGLRRERPYVTASERLESFGRVTPLRFGQSGPTMSRGRRGRPDACSKFNHLQGMAGRGE
jgi:hypothetical protein